MSTSTVTRPDATTAVAQLIRFVETGEAAVGLFASDVDSSLLGLPGRVTVVRVEPTSRGFTLEYAGATGRTMLRADVEVTTIVELVVYRSGPPADLAVL